MTLSLAFFASDTPQAQVQKEIYEKKYGVVSPAQADLWVVLGGDGTMLRVLRQDLQLSKPVFGINYGSVGFLMNVPSEENLMVRVKKARSVKTYPLKMHAVDTQGHRHEAYAVNEVSLLRQTHQAANLSVSVDETLRVPELFCDGVLLATPAGSTAYNLSAHGPILPLDSNLLALTPISPFRPRRWRGALLPSLSHVRFDNLEPETRPVAVMADNQEFRHMVSVQVHHDTSLCLTLLFDEGHSLEERIISEQFPAS